MAKQTVDLFHAQLNTEQYAARLRSLCDKFHQATNEAEFTKLLEAVHRKLGFVQQSNLRNTGIAWFAGQGASVSLVYDTKFAEGTGIEKFVWAYKRW